MAQLLSETHLCFKAQGKQEEGGREGDKEGGKALTKSLWNTQKSGASEQSLI